jgi:hypothetical protein
MGDLLRGRWQRAGVGRARDATEDDDDGCGRDSGFGGQ